MKAPLADENYIELESGRHYARGKSIEGPPHQNSNYSVKMVTYSSLVITHVAKKKNANKMNSIRPKKKLQKMLTRKTSICYKNSLMFNCET